MAGLVVLTAPRDLASVALPTDQLLKAMNYVCRLVIGPLALLLSVAINPVVAQEAVGETPGTSEEKPAEEATPAKAKASKEETPKPSKSLEETMRPEEFKAAGLDKLNEDELQHLDAYLQGYRESAKKRATEQAQAQANEEIKKAKQEAAEEAKTSARTKLDTLISRVDGSFEGLKGRTIIHLEDGTAWKQANADDRYRTQVTDHPAAVVIHSTFGYKMRIEGMPEFYVDPVRTP